MKKLFLFMMVSTDGYFEGLDHEIGWHHVDEEFNAFAVAQLDAIDTLLFGYKTYELMASYWPTMFARMRDPDVAERMNRLAKVVCSRSEKPIDWENTRLVSKDVEEEIRGLKSQPGKDLAIFGSNNLCVSMMKAGLVDEFRIMVNPVALGKGHSLFSGLEDSQELILRATRTFKSGNILLTYTKK